MKGVGLYGPGMHSFICEEAELGTRVAMALDNENNQRWSALDDLSYQEYVDSQSTDERIT